MHASACESRLQGGLTRRAVFSQPVGGLGQWGFMEQGSLLACLLAQPTASHHLPPSNSPRLPAFTANHAALYVTVFVFPSVSLLQFPSRSIPDSPASFRSPAGAPLAAPTPTAKTAGTACSHPNSLRARFPDHSHELGPKGSSRGNLPGHTQPTALTAAAYSLAYIQRLPPGASAPPPTSNDSIATNQLPPTSVAILARAIPLTTRAHHPYSPSAKERLFFRVGGRAHSLSRIIALLLHG